MAAPAAAPHQLLLLLQLVTVVQLSAALRCDWNGSGHAHGSTGHVTAVSLDCATGRVEWKQPQGLVRVNINPAHLQDFHLCLRVDGDGSSGARLLLELWPGRLQPLWTPPDLIQYQTGHRNQQENQLRWRCFPSRGGTAALYLEAVSEEPPLQPSALSFEYDAEPRPPDKLHDPLEDCRPCTDEEALNSFCRSEFVVRGKITSVHQNTTIGRASLSISAEKVIRQSSTIFTSVRKPEYPIPAARVISDRYRPALLANDLDSATDADPPEVAYGEVFVPSECDPQVGSGLYLLMGRHRLGVPCVTCSIDVHQWETVRRKAENQATNECVLDA